MKTMYIANRCDGISKEELEHMKTSDLQNARTQLIEEMKKDKELKPFIEDIRKLTPSNIEVLIKIFKKVNFTFINEHPKN